MAPFPAGVLCARVRGRHFNGTNSRFPSRIVFSRKTWGILYLCVSQLEEDARREERGRKKRWRALEDKVGMHYLRHCCCSRSRDNRYRLGRFESCRGDYTRWFSCPEPASNASIASCGAAFVVLFLKHFHGVYVSPQGDLELSIREAKEAALPTLPARDWLGQVRRGRLTKDTVPPS